MECLQGFFPFAVTQDNFWLKYSLVRDGASIETLLSKVAACKWTILAIETINGEVFGSFTGSPWRVSPKYFGSAESFLWRLKNSRILLNDQTMMEAIRNDMDLEMYPFTGHDNFVQHCTKKRLLVGGGEWEKKTNGCPHTDEREGVGLIIYETLDRGSSSSCATYANRALCKSQNGDFDVLNIEVWALTPCRTVLDAEKLQERKILMAHNFVEV